jgi:hypothetical protein
MPTYSSRLIIHPLRAAGRITALSSHLLPRIFFAGAALTLCGAALAQGFPGGGGGGFGGGGRGGHGGVPAADTAHRASPQAGKATDTLESLLRTAHELRDSMILDAKQTERWAQMQSDLHDALEKRRALAPKIAARAPNPTVLFIQDMATAESALGAALEKLAMSMQAAVDALDERQRNIFVEKTTAALTPTAPP